MTASIACVEDVLNLALTRIGYSPPINNAMEGSRASTIALNIYAQTRDELLRLQDWGFAERNAVLTVLKQAPAGGYVPPTVWSSAYPPLPWLYEYQYPADCLKVRALKDVPIFIPNFDPQPYVYRIANDNALNPPAKVILTNVPDAVMVYTGQVTDPAAWEADFVEAIAAALARRLAKPLADTQTEQIEIGDELAATAQAGMIQG